MTPIKKIVKSFLFRFRLIRIVNRFQLPWSIGRELKKSGMEIETLVDVGAHRGNFSLDILNYFSIKKAFLFEPNSLLVRQSLIPLSKEYGNLEVFQFALGSRNSNATLNVSANDGLSSSVLRMKKLHLETAPESKYEFKSEITVRKLDDIIPQKLRNILLKIDTQGYELEVLKGSTKTLKNCNVVIVEISFDELYQYGTSALEVMSFLQTAGFKIFQIYPVLTLPNGRWLQADAVFIRI